MKTAISMPDTLAAAVDRLAQRLGVSRSELIQRALRAYLEDDDQQAVTQALNAVYADAPDDAALDPALDALQRASLDKGAPW